MREAEVLSSTSIKINWFTKRSILRYIEGFYILYKADDQLEPKTIQVKDNKVR